MYPNQTVHNGSLYAAASTKKKKHLFLAEPLKEAFAFSCELKWGHLLGSMKLILTLLNKHSQRVNPSRVRLFMDPAFWQLVASRLCSFSLLWSDRLMRRVMVYTLTCTVEAFYAFLARNR